MRVSDYIVQRCAEAGIREVFMVCGGGAMYLDDSFGHSPKFRCTYHHHEQAAAMAAECYARKEMRPAVTLVTTGPGASNALTGVLCGWMESIPMLVISGQARFATTVRGSGLPLRTSGIQEFDITKAAAPMCKYAVMIEKKEEVRYTLEKALYLMNHGRKGPVWLDIPLDVQSAEYDPSIQVNPERQSSKGGEAGAAFDPYEYERSLTEEERATFTERVPEIPDVVIEEILSRLKDAERPVLFGGAGVRAALAASEFRKLAELLGIPVLTGMSSLDLVEEDFPYYAGRTGMTGTRSGNLAMAGSDVFLSIGSRMSFLQTGFNYKDWAREAYTIMNELDENELRKANVRCDLPVIGDAKELICKMNEYLAGHGASGVNPWCEKAGGWLARSVERRKKYPGTTPEQLAPQKDGRSNIYAFYDRLSETLSEGDVIVTSAGTARMAAAQSLRIRKDQRYYNNSATASMGYCLPAAIGAARANEGKEINLVTGEGSLMMNLQEMQTIATNHLPVRVFVIMNGGYHSIRQTQRAYFGEPLIGIGEESGDLGFPKMEKLADCFGFSFARVTSNSDLQEVLTSAMSLPLPAFVEIQVTPLQNTEPKSASRRLSDGSMVSSPLEDMAPFLSREELRENLEIPLTEGEAAL